MRGKQRRGTRSHDDPVAAGRPKNAGWARPLTQGELGKELGPLDTLEDVRRWVASIPRMAAVGMLPSSSVGDAAVRSVEDWCRNHEGKLPPPTVAALEREIAQIRSKLIRRDRTCRIFDWRRLTDAPGQVGGAAKRPVAERRLRQRRHLRNRRVGDECRCGADCHREKPSRTVSWGGPDAGRCRRPDRRKGLDRRLLADQRGIV